MKLDYLIFAAHPDDAELAMGGTIAKLVDQGTKVGIIDLTRGEMGTRGTVESRDKETQAATKILGVQIRVNLNLPDGHLEPKREFVLKVVEKIRQYKPKIIFAPHWNDRHPDHTGASRMVKEAMFFAGLTKIETSLEGKPQERYRPHKLFYFMQTYEFEPTFIVDISDYFDKKMDSLKAYGTQFFNPGMEGPETFISKMNFTKYIISRAGVYGFHIGKEYGEPFFSDEKIELDLKDYVKYLG
ncbi:MAG: bacillithiol biosynthesis deacetylase BshB1 [Melioribacteraceae bacterium]|nr:MAG: bacillithiol biosynthesis deacetylase BshB1 [Melioribacteraceae bacterium]